MGEKSFAHGDEEIGIVATDKNFGQNSQLPGPWLENFELT